MHFHQGLSTSWCTCPVFLAAIFLWPYLFSVDGVSIGPVWQFSASSTSSSVSSVVFGLLSLVVCRFLCPFLLLVCKAQLFSRWRGLVCRFLVFSHVRRGLAAHSHQYAILPCVVCVDCSRCLRRLSSAVGVLLHVRCVAHIWIGGALAFFIRNGPALLVVLGYPSLRSALCDRACIHVSLLLPPCATPVVSLFPDDVVMVL